MAATEKLYAFIGSPESPQLMCSIRIGKQGLAAKNTQKPPGGGQMGGFGEDDEKVLWTFSCCGWYHLRWLWRELQCLS